MYEHFLQSKIWENYEKTEQHQVFRLTDKDFNCLVVQNHTQLGDYFYLPYGPSLKTSPKAPNFAKTGQTTIQPTTTAQKSLSNALTALTARAKAAHAYFIRIEPTVAFTPAQIAQIAKKHGLKAQKSHDLDPAHTWAISLTRPEEEIFKEIEKSKVQRWRNHQKKGLAIRTTQDPAAITVLTNFLRQVSDKNHFIPQSEQHLKNQLQSGFATLYIADFTDPANAQAKPAPVAAALIYDHQGTRFYAHAAADPNPAYKKLVAPSMLLIQMIHDAKTAGAHTFDFWGITTSTDPHHPWYGFTQFKKSFGGHQIDYAGTYDLILKPARYRLYQILRWLNRRRRAH